MDHRAAANGIASSLGSSIGLRFLADVRAGCLLGPCRTQSTLTAPSAR